MKLLTLLVVPMMYTAQVEHNPCSPLEEMAQECVPPTAREEKSLFAQLTNESRRLYNALDCEGKRRAIELSTSYANKNQAVQLAAREMAKRRAELYQTRKTYPQQIRKDGGQEDYGERFGY